MLFFSDFFTFTATSIGAVWRSPLWAIPKNGTPIFRGNFRALAHVFHSGKSQSLGAWRCYERSRCFSALHSGQSQKNFAKKKFHTALQKAILSSFSPCCFFRIFLLLTLGNLRALVFWRLVRALELSFSSPLWAISKPCSQLWAISEPSSHLWAISEP